jgi:ABC-type multidrug transport system ATPase subunit
LINQLGLTGCRTSQVGDINRKVISGGERKRTAIGVELITNPSVLLLDEPTSGLDSFRALSIVKLLRKIARDEGKTIISTIHQPSSEAYLAFDKVVLMCDGYIVYQGKPLGVPAHFSKVHRIFQPRIQELKAAAGSNKE